MLQNSKPRPRHIKLDKQPGMPHVKLIEEIRQTAMVNPGSTVELPFGDETQTLILTVCRDIGKGSWLWMLYRDDGFSSALEWSQLSNDPNYIHALIENSHPGFVLKTRRTTETVFEGVGETTANIRKGSLQGNLKNIQIANLLQSVSMGSMTGRLQINAKNDTASIYFSGGKALHATLRGAEGNEAIVQLFAWEEGEFSFYDESVNVPTTVTRSLPGLMMEGATYVDHLNFLQNRGLTNECYPTRIVEFSSQAEFAAALKGAVDCDMRLQHSLYSRMTGNSSWAEIVRDRSEKKTEWVPALFNLVSCGLVQFETTALLKSQQAPISKIDWSIVQAIENSMHRADTGLCTYAALLYSLKQEFYRFEGMDLPFSLIVFGYCEKTSDPRLPARFISFKASAVSDMRERINKVKRKYDLLCHYGAFAYAMVLPLSLKENAQRFAGILADVCASINVSDEYPLGALDFRASAVNIPEDCNSVESMLELAEKL